MIATELKDLGTVAKRIVYGETPQTVRRVYSRLLNDYYFRTADGSTVFESGVIYTADELKQLKGIHENTLKAIHITKKIFQGSKVIK